MSYFDEVVRGFAMELTQPRRYNYSQEMLEEFLSCNEQVKHTAIKVPNQRNEKLDAMLLQHQQASTCVVYSHGLGSNRLEVLPLANFLRHTNYDICSFDFSGSGRSQGKFTTYGLWEQHDLQAVLSHLDRYYAYDKYVLWGRSMGAVATVLNQGGLAHRKVQCLVLDSPFSSFEKVAIELASKKSFIPEFMLNVLVEPLKKYLSTSHGINPFEMNIIERIEAIDLKVLLIYSKKDSIVDYSHSSVLARHCKKTAVEVEIQEDHNMHRSKDTYRKVLNFISNCVKENQKKVRRTSSRKARGISLASKDEKKLEQHNTRAQSIRNLNRKSVMHTPTRLETYSHFPQTWEIRLKSKMITLRSVQTEQDSTQMNKLKSISQSDVNFRHKVKINSVFGTQDKENIKPYINLIRRNRFH